MALRGSSANYFVTVSPVNLGDTRGQLTGTALRRRFNSKASLFIGFPMNASEWARTHGFTRQHASRLIKRGVIPIGPDGQLDQEAADAALAAMRDPARPLRRKAAPIAGKPATAESAAARPAPEKPAADRATGPKSLSTQLTEARIKTEEARAKQIEFENQVKAGRYVERDDVYQDAFRIGREVRDRLLHIPDRLSSVLASETDAGKVHEILKAEISAALSGLSDAA